MMTGTLRADSEIAGGLNWLYLDMNAFFASCAQQDDPDLRGKPVIVVPVLSDYSCAIAASYPAKAYGIKTGTQIGEAKRLCPGLKVVQASHGRYVHYHHKILEAVERIIPIDRVCSIDEVACRLLGQERHEANARAIGHRIQRAILEQVGHCLTASIGIGPSRLLAKTAADMKKPLGLTVVRRDHLPDDLDGLEIEDFAGIGRAMGGRLRAAGVHDVRTLWSLSPSRLRQIWGGVTGDSFWYALHGIDPRDIETERGSIGHSHVLAQTLRPVALARGVARRLTAKCGARLRRMGYVCGGLHMSVRAQSGRRAQAEMRFDLTADSFRLLEATDRLWGRCLSELKVREVKKVSVTCLKMVETGRAPDLFGWTPEAAENSRHMRLMQAMDGLNARFGKDAVMIGPPTGVPGFVGAKIAFNRIPEPGEFNA